MKWTFGRNFGLNCPERAFGFTAFRQRFARGSGIPTTLSGLNQKIGRLFTKPLLNLFEAKHSCFCLSNIYNSNEKKYEPW